MYFQRKRGKKYFYWQKKIIYDFYFDPIIFADNRLLDVNQELTALNLKLSVENEQLRTGLGGTTSSGNSAATAAKISQLENKLLTQQEELTELHKRKGENSQMIVDLSLKVEKQNKILAEKETRCGQSIVYLVFVFCELKTCDEY